MAAIRDPRTLPRRGQYRRLLQLPGPWHDSSHRLALGFYRRPQADRVGGAVISLRRGEEPRQDRVDAVLWVDQDRMARPDIRGGKRARLADIADEPFILLRQGYGLRILTERLCRQAGFTPRIAFEGEEIATLRALVAAELGVALLATRAETGPGRLGHAYDGKRSSTGKPARYPSSAANEAQLEDQRPDPNTTPKLKNSSAKLSNSFRPTNRPRQHGL